MYQHGDTSGVLMLLCDWQQLENTTENVEEGIHEEGRCWYWDYF